MLWSEYSLFHKGSGSTIRFYIIANETSSYFIATGTDWIELYK